MKHVMRLKKQINIRILIILLILVISGIAFLIWTGNKNEQSDKSNKPDTNTLSTPSELKKQQLQQQQTKPETQKEQPKTAVFDKGLHSVTDPTSIWVVVNKSRPFNPLTYVPNDLVGVGNGQYIRQEAATAFKELVSVGASAGLQLQPLSGYRSYQTQQVVYAREVATYGQNVADTQSAKPGHSEHQSGLTIDIGGGGCGIEDCFGNTTEGKWVAANAYLYGFIIRYPEDKESITGYRYEPWHIRYVGKELAGEMKRTNIQTLEEFFNL